MSTEPYTGRPSCRCCGKLVVVMAELGGARVYCGSLCRRGLCGHDNAGMRHALDTYAQLVREAHPPTQKLRELYRGAAG